LEHLLYPPMTQNILQYSLYPPMKATYTSHNMTH
jgi:hypothetical protein